MAIQLPPQLPTGIQQALLPLRRRAESVDLWFFDLATRRARRYLGAGSTRLDAGRGRGRDGGRELRPRRVVGHLQARSRVRAAASPSSRTQFLPIAFSVWDGAARRARQQARLTAWKYLYVEPQSNAVDRSGRWSGRALAVLGDRDRPASPGCRRTERTDDTQGEARSPCTARSTCRSTTPTTRTAPSPAPSRSARRFDATLVGCHVYAARMHDYRFKQMEYTLPDEYLDEIELERQRKIHDSLITHGPEADLRQLPRADGRSCAASSGLEFEPRMMDGKHHTEILRDIAGCRLRPGGARRPRHRPRARQRDRLGVRARRAQRRTATSGWSSTCRSATRPSARHDPGRHRRQPAVVRRAR